MGEVHPVSFTFHPAWHAGDCGSGLTVE